MNETKILVSDDVKESGLEPLRAAGFTIEKRTGMTPDELCEIIPGYDALIVRSETKVTARVMDEAVRLRAIGRAGVGVDNIDIAAATQRGILVMNAPDGNTITTAEHTIALLTALARSVPQASASLKAGRWERKRFVGVELQGKTLGIVGLGRIGRVVASRARGLGMNVVAYDPFVTPESLLDAELEFASLDQVYARADFLTVHTPLTPETRGIIGVEAFAKMKQGVRIINCARGGLVDEAALVDALVCGKVAGAALDVFAEEPPPTNHPLLAFDNVIVTPHLGASTTEAQEGVAVTVAEQMRDYFLTGALRGAVNAPAMNAQQLQTLQPYIELAESLGRFQAQLLDDAAVREVQLEYAGELAEMDAAPVTRAFVAGLLRNMSARVNVVNAFLIAEERGLSITTSYARTAGAGGAAKSVGTMSHVRTRVLMADVEQLVAGALFGPQRDGRITEINGFRLEAIPRGHLLVTRNRDVPGVIGRIGSALGERGVNISSFHLGRQERGGEAMAVIETDAPLGKDTIDSLRSFDEVIYAREIEL